MAILPDFFIPENQYLSTGSDFDGPVKTSRFTMKIMKNMKGSQLNIIISTSYSSFSSW